MQFKAQQEQMRFATEPYTQSMLTTCEAVYATANKVINANTEFYLFKKKAQFILHSQNR